MTSENLAFAILTTCFTATCPKFQSHFIFPNKGVAKIIVPKLLQHLWTLHSLLSPRSQCPRPTTTGEKTELVVPSRPGITCTTDFSNFLFPPGPSTTDSVTHTGSLFLSICRNHRLFCPLNLSGLILGYPPWRLSPQSLPLLATWVRGTRKEEGKLAARSGVGRTLASFCAYNWIYDSSCESLSSTSFL